MDFGPVLIIGFLGFLGWKFLTRGSSSQKNKSVKRKPQASSQDFHWEGKGDFDFEVVGESNYQRALSKISGQHGTKSVEQQVRAMLLLEDSNSYDPKAVAVVIEEEIVGYLSRSDARSYRRRLGQKGLSGTDATCDALIIGGGTKRNGEKLSYGVKLDIKPFE